MINYQGSNWALLLDRKPKPLEQAVSKGGLEFVNIGSFRAILTLTLSLTLTRLNIGLNVHGSNCQTEVIVLGGIWHI